MEHREASTATSQRRVRRMNVVKCGTADLRWRSQLRERPTTGSPQSYPESTDPQATSLQNAAFLLKASGQLRAPGVSVRRKRLCTKCNAWSDGRLSNHNQQRQESFRLLLRLQAPHGFRVLCTAEDFRLVQAFRQGITSHPCSRRNRAELRIFLSC